MNTVKLKLPFLETMVTQACNLSCLGCTNYSDLPHKGYVKWSDAKQNLKEWLTRIEIDDFGILGGEPLMNPEIEKWIIGLRELMPNAQIRFTTNGLLLDKKFHIVKLLHATGNCVLKITNHFDKNDKIETIIQKVFQNFDWTPVKEFGIDRYKTSNNLRFQINKPQIFYKTYRNNYENMMPHNSNPNDAINVCCQRYCPLLYQGKLYKCSTSALLQDTLDKVGNPNPEHWEPFLLNGLSTNCSENELSNFINNFGNAEYICQMCPTIKDDESKILHIENVLKPTHRLKKQCT